MGLFDKIFRPRNRKPINGRLWETMTAYSPVFTNWGGELYESELIRAVVDAEARHASKLSVSFEGAARASLKSAVILKPNPWQTWSQFFYRLKTILMLCNTAFIVPLLDDHGDLRGYFPVLPTSCEIVESAGMQYLRYHFSNGNTAAIELHRCGILTNHQFKDDIFGDSNAALNSTLSLIHKQQQGIEEGINAGATYRFIASMDAYMDPEDITREQKAFNERSFSGEAGGGVLLFPLGYKDPKQINSQPFLVDAAQMQLIQTNVFNFFGSNMEVIQSTAIGDKLDAFWNSKLEPFSIQCSEVMTVMTYTQTEIQHGNRVMVNANRLQYMSVEAKINMAKEMGDRGVMLIDEIRELLNYPPLPNGAGQHAPIRGEYYMLDEGKDEKGKEEKDDDE